MRTNMLSTQLQSAAAAALRQLQLDRSADAVVVLRTS